MIRLSPCCIIVLLSIGTLHAQFLENLKKATAEKAKELATKENIEKAGNAVMKDLDKARASFDSTDFDYAILLRDNSAVFDLKEKGETTARISTLANISSAYYNNKDLTDAEKARFNLDLGEMAYAQRKFSYAEKRFSAAQTAFETANLKEDIAYLKTISNEGLLYATMGRFTQAEAFTGQALELRRGKYGDNNIAVASSLNNYGVLHYNLGRYSESEKAFTSAINIILSTSGGQDLMQHAIVLNNQAMLFQEIGRYEEAVKALMNAITIGEKLQSKKSKNHLKFLSKFSAIISANG